MGRVITEEWCVDRYNKLNVGDEIKDYKDLIKYCCPSDIDLVDVEEVKCMSCIDCSKKCINCWLYAIGSIKEEV